MGRIRSEIDGHVLTITIDIPQTLNSISASDCFALDAAWTELETNPDLWVAIVTGAGDKAFCAGHDLSDDLDDPLPPTGWLGLAERKAPLTKPLIAAVNGLAYGGGFELALYCDIIVADERAIFAMSEPRVGFAAAGGGADQLALVVPRPVAMGMLLTGRKIDASEAGRWGIATEVVPAGTALAGARRWAGDIMRCAPLAVRYTKELANKAIQGLGGHDAMIETRVDVVRRLKLSEDTREGMAAFAQKRAPQWSAR